MNLKRFHTLVFLFICLVSLSAQAQTTIAKTNGDWSLLVDGKPFEIKGVTFGYVNDVENYQSYFEDLKFLGVNTIRIWATNDDTQTLLDVAHANNIKVMVGIWMRHGRPGMEDDDRFNYLEDNKGMETMYNNALKVVETYKNHPAVLTWAIGNEVYLNMATDLEKEAYSKLLERICSAIKKEDSNHPITSVEAWTFGLEWWETYVPSIDIYGLNSYGPGANFLASELKKRTIDKPYIITEFGVTGEWDIKDEKHGITVEPSDKEKHEAITKGYTEWIQPHPNCLGVYIFHYANGNEFISPWLLTHHNNKTRPQYWAIREAYTGQQPENYVPEISTFELPDSIFESETWIPVKLTASDVENEKLEVRFFYNQRTGSRKRRNQINPLNQRGNLEDGFEIQLPKEDGAIKVYVNVSDSFDNVGIASTAILVSDEDAKNRKFKVPKVELPFFVYNDGDEPQPYVPSGYMGNYDAMEVDLNHKEEVYSGHSAIQIKYKSDKDWYGLGFVDPANDWGDILGGYDISGAKTFSFWAKASISNVHATIGFGLIDKDKPYPDSAKKSIDIELTTEWKKYTIKTKNLDLSCIRSGLVLFSSAHIFSHEIYLDEIVFE
jgi:hypothetical protein